MTINLKKELWAEIKLSKKKESLISGGIVLSFFLLLVACSFHSKDAYLEDFSEFVTNVEQNYQSYTEDDWTAKGQEYEEYVGESYEKFSAKLTVEDRKRIGKLKAKYQTIVIEHNVKSIIDDITDGLNQLEGVVDGVLEEINK